MNFDPQKLRLEVYAYGMVVMEMLLNTMPACMGQAPKA